MNQRLNLQQRVLYIIEFSTSRDDIQEELYRNNLLKVSYFPRVFTKKFAIMWLASIASGSPESYQKACGSAS